MDLAAIWPPFGLRITMGTMELTPTRESDYPELAEIARGGVRRDDAPAFLVDWDSGTDEEIAKNIAHFQWATRANFSRQEWTIEFTARVDGRVIGLQGITGKDFLATKSVTTGSWLARVEQGQGYGTQMRRAVVTAFADHFDVEVFHTAHIDGNDASRRVSEKLGYAPNGQKRIVVQDGNAHTEHQLVLPAADIIRGPEPVEVTGTEAVRRFLGLDTPT